MTTPKGIGVCITESGLVAPCDSSWRNGKAFLDEEIKEIRLDALKEAAGAMCRGCANGWRLTVTGFDGLYLHVSDKYTILSCGCPAIAKMIMEAENVD